MSLFEIDQTKCKRDGFCVSDCPAQIIQMKTKESFPAPVDGADELCIKCGHCVAVCPHAAIALNFLKPGQCEPVSKKFSPSPEQTAYLMKSRRSIRRYKQKPVDRSILNDLIQVANHAPSGHNSQPVHWLVVENKDDMKSLAAIVIDWMKFVVKAQPEFAKMMSFDHVISAWGLGKDRVLRDAPHMIVAHGLSSLPPAQTACVIALTYMELYAASKGLGTCWAGYFNAAANFFDPMKQALALPAGHQTFGALMIGYPSNTYHRIPTRNEPRVTWR
jgi:nitroreductase/NAD-dependent dihydropyrimidine dehydrogenase PreA subunit